MKDDAYYADKYPLLWAYKKTRPILPGMAGGNQVFMDEDLRNEDGSLQTVTDMTGTYTHQQINELREAAMLRTVNEFYPQIGQWGGTATAS